MINHPWFASASVGFMLILGQIVDQLDGLPSLLKDGGTVGLILAAMVIAYRLIAKAQQDALTIREESFDNSNFKSDSMIEDYRKSLIEERNHHSADRIFFNSEINKLLAERNASDSEVSELKSEIGKLKAENETLRMRLS